MEKPLQSASPWPNRRLKSPAVTRPKRPVSSAWKVPSRPLKAAPARHDSPLTFALAPTEVSVPRTDFRADVRFGSGPWLGTGRLENVFCEGYGLLSYLEGGYKADSWSTYLRLTGFHIGHWDDRIFVYERDAAGTFSVPAYYGKGAAFSAVGSFKHRFRRLTVKANLRAACQPRAGRVPDYTLNLQIQCDL